MKFSSYAWLALVVFLLGLIVLHQGWNHGDLAGGGTQMPHSEAATQGSHPAPADTVKDTSSAGGSNADKSANTPTGGGHTGADKATDSTSGHDKQ